MNNFDVEMIKALAEEAGLTFGGTRLVGRQIMLIYADLKHPQPRSIGTIIDTLYRLMRERNVMYGIGTSSSRESKFPTLLFTQHEQVSHE